MLLRLRVSLPDRPGVLGQVARAFGVMGADILQVTVLERQSGRAVDDFTVSWSGVFEPGVLRERIGVVPGTRVEAVWPTREVPGSTPDYDLLGHVAADPDRAYVTLVDAVPDLVSAEWAVAVDSADGTIVHGSWQAPETVPAADLTRCAPRPSRRAGCIWRACRWTGSTWWWRGLRGPRSTGRSWTRSCAWWGSSPCWPAASAAPSDRGYRLTGVIVTGVIVTGVIGAEGRCGCRPS